jgi:gamma-glutamyl:cysteine ligase YbdK (ATP-grasp superfamily)
VSQARWGLFEAVGIELEYMIVDATTLDVRPIADALMAREAGEPAIEVDRGAVAWSNELALHVVELKSNGPVPDLSRLEAWFAENLVRVQGHLDALGARLLPTGMHPWMDPERELRLWPHEQNDIYRTFHRIFDCRGHGWANLQSTHINLPFDSPEDFVRLHDAIRLTLPLLPALAASSPVVDGRLSGLSDTRLDVYRHNADRIPSVAGYVIPERVSSPEDYQRRILEPIQRDVASHDPEGILEAEWVNARGAIARFGRGSIEIRVLDIQECPTADLAVCAATIALIRSLVEERIAPHAHQIDWPPQRLAAILDRTIRDGDAAPIDDPDYLALLGVTGRASTAGEVWRSLLDRIAPFPGHELARFEGPLDHLTRAGCLSRRIRRRLGSVPSRGELAEVYRELAGCLGENRLLG